MKQRYRSLADYFEQTGETQSALARELGISKGFMTMLVNGERHASSKLAAKIAGRTGVAITSLVSPATVALLARVAS